MAYNVLIVDEPQYRPLEDFTAIAELASLPNFVLAGPAVNPANADRVAKAWAEASPQVVVIDDLLTPEGSDRENKARQATG